MEDFVFFSLELWAEAGLPSILRVNRMFMLLLSTFFLFYHYLSPSLTECFSLTTPAVSLSFFP